MIDVDVAVVIVTYKVADLTIDCLRSIESERSNPDLRIRVVVVDNASGDAPAIMKAIRENGWASWVTLLEAPRNGGFAYGNNLGIERAYREHPPTYVHLLNPDTRVRKGAIGTLVGFLETHPHVGIVGSSLEDSGGNKCSCAFRFPSMLTEFEQGLSFSLATALLKRWNCTIQVGLRPQPVDWVSGASMMIRRPVIDTIGGLDENYFLYFEEVDFCFRARAAGFRTWCVPNSRVEHISGQSTHVTGRQIARKPMPPYWFESRRRYYVTNYGLPYAMANDLLTLLAHGLGLLKRLLQGRVGHGTPHFVRDLYRHSTLWSENRKVLAIKHFIP
jgi:GT2 family glycosyltransferase